MGRLWRPADLLHELAIEEPAELHVEALARRCGAQVWYKPLEGCEANIYGWGDQAIITVNSSSRRERQRFSVGHELGHWMHDRGTLAFRCDERAFYEQWFTQTVNVEERANRFATELLLPESMFAPRVAGLPITLETAREVARIFEMSLTATAIRLVELGSYPAMVYCTRGGRRHWFRASPDFPDNLWPREWPGERTLAHELLKNHQHRELGPRAVSSGGWLEHQNAACCRVQESSVRMTSHLILTLLWWENEDGLVELLGDDEDLLYA